MQMQQLRYFLAVIDHGGFTRAAAHLGRTQQAVSKALGLLEAELGVRLLDRESGLPQPTAFGRELERNGHLSILPTALVGRELHAGTLVALEAPQFAWQRPLELACRADAAARPALLAVVQSLHEASDALRISGIS